MLPTQLPPNSKPHPLDYVNAGLIALAFLLLSPVLVVAYCIGRVASRVYPRLLD